MEKSFSGFTKQIPNKNMQNDEKYFGHNIAIFKPKEYITDKIVKSDDYHMFILSSAPPDIYVNGRKQLLQQGCIFVLIQRIVLFVRMLQLQSLILLY